MAVSRRRRRALPGAVTLVAGCGVRLGSRGGVGGVCVCVRLWFKESCRLSQSMRLRLWFKESWLSCGCCCIRITYLSSTLLSSSSSSTLTSQLEHAPRVSNVRCTGRSPLYALHI